MYMLKSWYNEILNVLSKYLGLTVTYYLVNIAEFSFKYENKGEVQ